MINKQIDLYLHYIDEQRYFDAHEALEFIWFARRFENNNEIKLIKGFINAAVSFELIKRGRKVQSKKAWANYLKYRQLLYKIDSIHLKRYHQVARDIEACYKNIR